MSETLKTLKVELQDPKYAAMTDAEIAAALSAPTVVVKGLVDIADVVTALRETGTWYTIKKAADSNLAAYAAVDLVSDMRAQQINFENPFVGQMGALLVSAALITQAEWDALAGLGSKSKSWAEVNCGVPYLSAADIKAMRS